MEALEVLSTLTQCPFFVTFVDRRGNLAYSSAYAYGLEPPDVLGRPADHLVLAEDRPVWWDAFRRARDGREVVRYTVRLSVPEEPRVVRIAGRTAPVVAPDGRVRGVVCVTFDATSAPPECCLGCSARPGCRPEPPTPEKPEKPAAKPLPPGDWLSPLEGRVVEALAGRDGWTTAEVIARLVGENNTGDFRAVVRNLAERGVIESCSGKGYRPAG